MTQRPRRSRTPDELEELLQEQLAFIERSAAAFDAGMEGEAKRLAVSLRVLLHDTRTSRSLLAQLDRKNLQFVDTASHFDASNRMPHSGLVSIAMSPQGTRHVAMLDDVPAVRTVDFDRWWNAPVFVDQHRAVLTRKDLVLTAANQDGGAHVDPALDEVYDKLARDNSMGRFVIGGHGNLLPMDGPERAAIRQIAHEVRKTLKPGDIQRPQRQDDFVWSGMRLIPRAVLPQSPGTKKPGRNEPCYCGSGKKYKKCHGAPPT